VAQSTWHKANPVLKCLDAPSGLAAHEKLLTGWFLQLPPCFLTRQPRAARVRVLGLVGVGGRVRWWGGEGGGGWPLGGALATHRMTTMLVVVGLCV
jgi:hypothetical protein